MAIKGSLKEAGLADVCQLLSMGQKTGCLSVTDRSRFGQIYFDHGRITYAAIVNRRDRLGDLLVREGAITHQQLTETIDAQAGQPDRRLGELLLEAGRIDTETLNAAIRRQIEEAVYYLFTWKRGSFYFEVGRVPESGEILIAVNPETLLLEGARRVDEWGVIEKKIASMDLIFGLDEERVRETGVSLTPPQQALLPLIDGRHTVEDLAEASGLDEFTTAKALYGLIQAGFSHRVGRREPDQAVEPGDVQEARNLGAAFYETAMFEDAEREFRRVLQSEPHDRRSRQYLALIALRQGQVAQAVRRLTALLEVSGPRTETYLNLAYALRLQGRFADALRVLGGARGLAGNDPRVLLAQAATTLFSGDTHAALQHLEEYAGVTSGKERAAPYYYCAALAEAVEDRLELAEALVEEGVARFPSAPPLHLLAGTLAERRGDTADAERHYHRAAEEDAGLAQAHRSLGDVALRRGVQAEALEHYRRALEADPDLGDEVYVRMGDLLLRRNDREEAIRCWRRALAMNPDNEVARSHLEVVARAAI